MFQHLLVQLYCGDPEINSSETQKTSWSVVFSRIVTRLGNRS